MSVNSKRKGNAFERYVSNYLSECFADHLGVKTAFRRNIDSGAMYGGENQSRTHYHSNDLQQFGDIVTIDSFQYVIECKHYKQPISMNCILKQDCKLFNEWIKQVEQDAINAHRFPMLIIKFNNVKPFVMIKDDIDGLWVFRYLDYYAYPLERLFTEIDLNFFIKKH